MRIVVAGGGAAGFFAATACAQSLPGARVLLLEKSPELLAKVSISGGGRCNVTHACFDPAALVKHYPRGGRELLGPFHRWQPADTVRWFESRGVPLKTESDGRMFPATDQSSSITECLLAEARRAGVEVATGCGLRGAAARAGGVGFELRLTDRQTITCDRLLIATGGNQSSLGFDVAQSLGHTLEELVPSLFTFDVADARIAGLPGLSVADVEILIAPARLKQRGPLLITHWGLSGPAILKLSAWGARALHQLGYQFDFQINWLPRLTAEALQAELGALRTRQGGRAVASASPFVEIPNRLWHALAAAAGVGDQVVWAKLTREQMARLHAALHQAAFQARGKSMNKDEFVTCGGVSLREVSFKTMESKRQRGLYFAGEILDIDGVTGGFNFQAAWTTGWIAGKSMGQEA